MVSKKKLLYMFVCVCASFTSFQLHSSGGVVSRIYALNANPNEIIL